MNRDPRRYGPDWAAFRPERWAASWRNSRFVRPGSEEFETNDIQKVEGVDNMTTSFPPACKGGNDVEGGVGDTAYTNVGEVGPKWRDFFMPFGSGPRSCLGQQMVQSEVGYVIVRLLQEFQEIRAGVDDVQPFKEAEAVSFYNADGVVISVE